MNYVIVPQEFKTVKLAFKETNIEAFDSIYGVILWCCLKQRCITDQHFDNHVSAAAVHYSKYCVEIDYLEFRDSFYHSIKVYVTDSRHIHDSFLLMLHQLLLNPSTFSFEIECKVYNLSRETLKIFKPEDYI